MSQSKPKKKEVAVDPNKLVECPICLDVITPPISQCQIGHTMCKYCFIESNLTFCPLCSGPMSDKRHVAFEQLLESVRSTLQISCRYSHKGCKYDIKSGEKEAHERDCKFRNFRCEGRSFAGWKCDWMGSYENLENHFKQLHKNNTFMKYKTEGTMKISFTSNYKDIQLISFFNGQAYFYYKHFVDVEKEKIYWAFQYVGLKANAEHFFYEFEVYNGSLRKFKVSEVCHNDTTKIEDIFELEKCVVMSFAAVRNFLNDEGELPFRFRILKNKPVSKKKLLSHTDECDCEPHQHFFKVIVILL